MHDAGILHSTLNRIDGKGYKAYKDIEGTYEFSDEGFVLHVDHVQGDPFAGPSKLRVTIPQEVAGFPPETYSSWSREVGTRDFITRLFQSAIRKFCKNTGGSGKSGVLDIDSPGQEVLERTSAFINEDEIEIRFTVGLPAFGRKIAGKEALRILFSELPDVVHHTAIYDNIPGNALFNHIEVIEDADVLRHKVIERGLVSFIADGAILPRNSGVDPRPLQEENVVPFQSPESFHYNFELPNKGEISGMGIPEGVSLIVGGGFHGKSTVLNAIETGVYNHIPGDGREFVVTNEAAIKVRAEDGRRIENVDITPFINNLPFQKSTRHFSTENASGSTSQAANIIEALEADASALLIDEDTSATNFMIRDQRMQQLIAKEKEPITPFIDKIRQLYSDFNVSTILVMGGSGDYFEHADHVIGLYNYAPWDYTEEAHQIARMKNENRSKEGGSSFGEITPRYPVGKSIRADKGKKQRNIKVRGRHIIQFGTQTIDLAALEQIVDSSQTEAIADAIYYARKYMDGNHTLKEIINKVKEDISQYGLNRIGGKNAGNYALFRPCELAAAINRLRTLEVKN